MNEAAETYSRLLKERIIFLGTQIDNDVANGAIAQLLFLESESSERDIYLYINSPGGAVTSGMAIYDAIQNIKSDVVTVCVGLAASMAAILLSAGTKGKRYSLPSSRIMINKPCMGENVVDVDVLILQQKEVMFWRSELSKIIALHTNQPIEKVYEDTEQDYFMSAMEAKEYRIIDRVVSKKPKTINN